MKSESGFSLAMASLPFDQYLSLICVCIYSSRFCESFEPLGPLNLGTKNDLMWG